MRTADKVLPGKFTDEERKAYQWLYDCAVRPWFVDLLTKRVYTENGVYANLVEYRKHIEAGAAGEGGAT